MQNQNYKKRPYKKTSTKKPYVTKPKYKKKKYTIKVDRPMKERKVFTNPYSLTDISNDPTNINTLEFLGCPKKGSASWQRIGDSIIYKSIMFKCMINDPKDLETCRTFRIAIIYDKSPTGALPKMTDIWQDITVGGVLSTNGFSGMNMSNTNRFSVIREYIRSYSNSTKDPNTGQYYNYWSVSECKTQGARSNANYIEDYIKLPNLPQIFKPDGDTGNIEDVKAGAFYIAAFGTAQLTMTTIGWSARMKYSDN